MTTNHTDTADPPTAQPDLRAQSLAQGTAGIALLHIERAHRDTGTWADAHTHLAACASNLLATDDAALYLGAPAVAFALHTASVGTGRYTSALDTLDAQIARLTRTRLAKAHSRIDRGERPRLGEFDLFYGLTGLGSYLLCRDPHAPPFAEILTYLTRLTLPLHDDDQLPGWWTLHDPTGGVSDQFPGGHGNHGMAHGITGVLSLLAVATRRGIVVDGQIDAIHRICAYLDNLRQDTPSGTWWPQWITLAEHHTTQITQPRPRPTWCYGTPGQARAHQLAGLALNDHPRTHMAEQAMLACLADPTERARITDAGICHGTAGLLHTAHRVARDANVTGYNEHLTRLHTDLLDRQSDEDGGFLDGEAGRALTLMASETGGRTASGWDACLLSG